MKNQSVTYLLDIQLFAEDTPPVDDTPNNGDIPPAEKNSVETLKKLRENTVSKEQYLKVVQENKQLWEAALNGDKLDEEEKEKEAPNIKELREDLFGGKKQLTNLEYWDKTLKLRKALMEKGETDPFVPVGEKIVPEQSDFDAAQRVADVVQECIDYANGDSIVFTNELQRRTIDTPLPRR